MNFFQILVNLITKYSFIPGILLFINLKLKKFDKLRIPGVHYPLSIRKGTSDLSVLFQIFIQEEYEFNYKGKINTIIDAGANVGYATVYFANRFRNARLLAVEPDSENYNVLLKNTELLPNVKTIKGALWNKNTNIEVKDSGGGQWAYVVEECSQPTAKSLAAYPISELMKKYDFNYIDILKVDIEGSEKEVFEENYESWLPLVKYLIVETHDRMKKDSTKAVFETLAKYNFSCHLNGENFIFVNEDRILN